MIRLLCICVLSFAIMTMAEDTNVEEILREGNDQFTAKMFYEVTKLNQDKNVVLSAFSVLSPLALLAFASVGESHDELLNAIGMPNDNVTKAVFSQIDSKLRSTKGIKLNTASKVYVGEKFQLNSDFAAVARDTFRSEAKNINFENGQVAADEINGWVEDQTNHKIKKLVDPSGLDGDTVALLVNAIYFKGAWQDPFSKLSTTDRDFHVTKDKVVQVPTMYRRGFYKYAESSALNAQILEIPYSGEESSFVVVLPREVDGIVELEEKLKDPKVLYTATQNMKSTKLDVYIPKFKIETTTNLKEVLEKLNVKRLFSRNEARLENMLKNDEKLYIDTAIQKAFIEVNEEGSEAAAANKLKISFNSLVIEKLPPQFNADRPFYYAVKVNSLTLFNGIMRQS